MRLLTTTCNLISRASISNVIHNFDWTKIIVALIEHCVCVQVLLCVRDIGKCEPEQAPHREWKRSGRRAESKTETWDYISKYEITCRSRFVVKHWNKFSAASTNCNSTTISISFSAALLVLPVRRMRNFQPANLSAFWNFANWISGANSSSNVRRKFCFCWIQTMLKYLCRILFVYIENVERRNSWIYEFGVCYAKRAFALASTFIIVLKIWLDLIKVLALEQHSLIV